MSPLTLDLEKITVDLLRPGDNQVLTDAVRRATSSNQPMTDGAGFDNKV